MIFDLILLIGVSGLVAYSSPVLGAVVLCFGLAFLFQVRRTYLLVGLVQSKETRLRTLNRLVFSALAGFLILLGVNYGRHAAPEAGVSVAWAEELFLVLILLMLLLSAVLGMLSIETRKR